MSLQLAAQQLAAQGRGPDKMLVHMSPNEVRGLQGLAMAKGGSLTINPQTGLPEAGFLEDLLPTLAGIGLSFIPGVGPLGAAAIVGGGTAAVTGDIGKGLLAGLGAWGGAGLTDAIGQIGTQALAQQAGTVGANLGEQALAQTATQALPAGYDLAGAAFNPTEMLAGSVAPQQFATMQANAVQSVLTPQNFGNLGAEQLGAMQTAATRAANPMDIARAAGMANAPIPTPTEAITAGARQQFMPSGSFNLTDAAKGAYNLAAQNPYTAASAMAPTIVGALNAPGVVTPPPTDEEDSDLKRISPNFKPIYTAPRYYTPQYPVYGAEGGEVRGLAMGGQPSGPVERMAMTDMQRGLYPQGMIDATQYATPTQMPASMEIVKSDYDTGVNPITGLQPIGMNKGGVSHLPVKGVYSDSDPDTAKKSAEEAAMIRLNKLRKAASLPGVKMPGDTVKGLGDIPTVSAAQGGHLGGYSDGGRMLKGPGDGMSDDIPATISGKQPARLADGEFVVPADVVSHLGNGSTDAGARKLYKMMDRVRKARTGKKKQAPAVKTEKFLPA